MMPILFAALAVLPAPAAQAQSVDWVSLYSDRDGETFYDPKSVTRSGTIAELVLRMIAKDAPWSAVARVEIDCKAQTIGFLRTEQFGADGKLIKSRIAEAGEIERLPIYEGEDMAPIYRTACPKGTPLPTLSAGPQIMVVPPKPAP